jgi:CheY-like chemotaxis protein
LARNGTLPRIRTRRLKPPPGAPAGATYAYLRNGRRAEYQLAWREGPVIGLLVVPATPAKSPALDPLAIGSTLSVYPVAAMVPMAGRAGAKIVIVEDHQTMREAMRLVLEPEGFDIREAADGPAALATIREDPPDLVFLDLNIPGSSGSDVLRELKSDPVTAGVRVIIVTATGDEAKQRVEERILDLLAPRPLVSLTLRNFTGLRLAYARGKPLTAGVWLDEPRRLNFDWHLKRDVAGAVREGEAIRTKPRPGRADYVSRSYGPDDDAAMSMAAALQRLTEAFPDFLEFGPTI